MLKTGRLVAITVGAFALVALSISSGIAGLARSDNPLVALRFSPLDAKAHEQRAEHLILAKMSDRNWRAAEVHARSALARSPLSPGAARVLGFVNEREGNRAQGRELVLQAAFLTRRDLLTRIWLIEDAVSRNDVPGALNEFDIAMRRSRPARNILFPILAGAVADPTFIDPVTALFRRSPNWAAEFLQTAIADGTATENLAQIVARSPQIRAIDGDLRQQVIQQLVRENKFEAARRFQKRIAPQTTAALSDPEFRGTEGYRPFVWNISSEASHGAAIGDGLDFHAEGGSGGQVASQLLTLSPGRYRLSSVGNSTALGGAQWTVQCGGNEGAKLGQVPLPVRPGLVALDIEVPIGCVGQWLVLEVRGGSTAGGVTGHVQSVDIRPTAS